MADALHRPVGQTWRGSAGMRDSMADRKTTAEGDRTRTLRQLRELIAALDRRVPHIEDTGEVVIARDAAALRKKAMQRIAELESEN